MTYLIGSLVLRIGGWRLHGGLPPGGAVIAVAPHTSNWDFFWLFFVKWRLRLHPRFLAKHTLFEGAVGWFMRRVGGIPVDRRARGDVVGQATGAFRAEPGLKLVLAPEGTRRRTAHWKSGFYEIARSADVPIVPVSINYEKREVVVGDPIRPGADRAVFMDELRAFFSGCKGRDPDQQGPVRLKNERRPG